MLEVKERTLKSGVKMLNKDIVYYSYITKKVLSYLEVRGYNVQSYMKDMAHSTDTILLVHWGGNTKHIMHGSSGVGWHRDIVYYISYSEKAVSYLASRGYDTAYIDRRDHLGKGYFLLLHLDPSIDEVNYDDGDTWVKRFCKNNNRKLELLIRKRSKRKTFKQWCKGGGCNGRS